MKESMQRHSKKKKKTGSDVWDCPRVNKFSALKLAEEATQA